MTPCRAMKQCSTGKREERVVLRSQRDPAPADDARSGSTTAPGAGQGAVSEGGPPAPERAPNACPECGEAVDRDEVDIGVGTMYGPPSCPGCGWAPEER